MIKPTGGGFQLFSKKNPGKALGPVRASEPEVAAKDEARVKYFAGMKSGRKTEAKKK